MKDDLDIIRFNPVASVVRRWQTSYFLGGCKTCTGQRETMKYCTLVNLSMMNNFERSLREKLKIQMRKSVEY
jgi:hypothetical protein